MRGKLNVLAAAGFLALTAAGCRSMNEEKNFIDDVRFLRENEAYPIVLKNADGARAAVCPKFQGSVMTSTPGGDTGYSCGRFNRKLIISGAKVQNADARGGEDRFLLGPEGGKFSLYFPKNTEFKPENRKSPEIFTSRTWLVTDRSGDSEITLSAHLELENRNGNKKEVRIERTIRLLSAEEAGKKIGIAIPKDKVKTVAFTSSNRITNKGAEAWTRETGPVSIRISGFFKPSGNTVTALPFRKEGTGPIFRSDLSDRIPEDLLSLREEKGILYLAANGKERIRIGSSGERAKGFLASYDPEHKLLTLAAYPQPVPGTKYANSSWKNQKEPLEGDASGIFFDRAPGSEYAGMEPFYGLETFSPAAFLKPDESLVHEHTTFHFIGEEAELDRIVRAVLGVSLTELKSRGSENPPPPKETDAGGDKSVPVS